MKSIVRILVTWILSIIFAYFILVSLNILLDTWVYSPWNVADLYNGLVFAAAFGLGIPSWITIVAFACLVSGLVWCAFQVVRYMLRRWQ